MTLMHLASCFPILRFLTVVKKAVLTPSPSETEVLAAPSTLRNLHSKIDFFISLGQNHDVLDNVAIGEVIKHHLTWERILEVLARSPVTRLSLSLFTTLTSANSYAPIDAYLGYDTITTDEWAGVYITHFFMGIARRLPQLRALNVTLRHTNQDGYIEQTTAGVLEEVSPNLPAPHTRNEL